MIAPINSITSNVSADVLAKSQDKLNANTKLLRDLLRAETDTNKAEQNKAKDVKDNSETPKTANFDALSEKLKEILSDETVDIKFDKDESTKQMIMRLVDKETKETIKQFPPEITIKIAKMVSDFFEHGAIADATA